MAKANRVHSTPRTTASEFLTTVNRLQISLMIRDPFVATAFKAVEAAEDAGPAPASPRHPAPPSPIRALTIFESLPCGHNTLLISDDASAPHLKAGEYAVIDTLDRELQAGELYLIQYSNGRHVVQIRTGQITTDSGRRQLVWWASDLAGYRQTDEKFFGIPVFAGMSDGPYAPGQLKKKLLGRVVGYAETALGGLLAPCAGRG
jgi:hypothetical protein